MTTINILLLSAMITLLWVSKMLALSLIFGSPSDVGIGRSVAIVLMCLFSSSIMVLTLFSHLAS